MVIEASKRFISPSMMIPVDDATKPQMILFWNPNLRPPIPLLTFANPSFLFVSSKLEISQLTLQILWNERYNTPLSWLPFISIWFIFKTETLTLNVCLQVLKPKESCSRNSNRGKITTYCDFPFDSRSYSETLTFFMFIFLHANTNVEFLQYKSLNTVQNEFPRNSKV